MSKRKQGNMEEEADSGDENLVNVDFDFFDPNPDVDFLAVKRLASQLFQGDAQSMELHDLADLVLSQARVGTTVKCDGKESDPYAFLTVINLHVHQARPFAKTLVQYVLSKSSPDAKFHTALQSLLGPEGLKSQKHVAFVFSERLVNIPVQIMPPMYKMLGEEIQWAVDENEPFRFSHYLFLAQIYRLTAEEAAELESSAPRPKKAKNDALPATGGVFSVHPEDEYIQKFASHTMDFSYNNTEPRDKESFGLDMGCRIMLVPAENMSNLVEALADAFPAPS